MNRVSRQILISIILFATIFSPIFVGAITAEECTASGGVYKTGTGATGGAYSYCETPSDTGKSDSVAGLAMDWAINNIVVKSLFTGIGQSIIALSSFILWASGWLFDEVVKYTIVDMAKNLNEGGLNQSIGLAWGTLRDIANMAFIFVLLYAAFKAMFDANFSGAQTIIKNIIIVALIINFSLFLTKVVIDASNVVSIGFYRSITTSETTVSGINNSGETVTAKAGSISGSYMRILKIHTWFSSELLEIIRGNDTKIILTISVFTSIFLLIVSVLFFVMAIMLATRFIVLIFLMVLSPIAFVSIAIPNGQTIFNKWKDSLVSQAFFAPIFFALTWVSLRLASSLDISGLDTAKWSQLPDATNNPGVQVLLLNYALVIGFAIMALVLAKQTATKAVGFAQISGAIGAGAVGATAWAGRNTMGRTASRIAESKWLNDRAGKSATAMATLQAARKVGSGSFDFRGIKDTSLGKVTRMDKIIDSSVVGDVSEKAKGGYNAQLKRQIEKKDKIAESLKTDQAKQDYAKRQMSGLTKWARGGSRPWHGKSLFGTMGRANRISASKILSGQIENLKKQRDSLQNEDNQLNQRLSSMVAEQSTITAKGAAASPAELNRLAVLNDPTNRNGIAWAQNRLLVVNNLLNDPTNGIIPKITNIQNDIDSFGIDNPSDTVTNPNTGATRAKRADEQNY